MIVKYRADWFELQSFLRKQKIIYRPESNFHSLTRQPHPYFTFIRYTSVYLY